MVTASLIDNVVWLVGHPFPGIFAFIESELKGTAARDTAKLAGGKLGVALKFEPIHEAVLAAVGVHGVQQRFAIQTLETLRTKTLSKQRVTFRQAFFRQELAAFQE